MKTLVSFLAVATLVGCAAKPPALSMHMGKDFPVYAPSRVETAMIVEKADEGEGCEFRVSETLVPGLKYPD